MSLKVAHYSPPPDYPCEVRHRFVVIYNRLPENLTNYVTNRQILHKNRYLKFINDCDCKDIVIDDYEIIENEPTFLEEYEDIYSYKEIEDIFKREKNNYMIL